MKFLLVLAAAVACAIAEPQFTYTTYPGYTAGVVPAVGYHGSVVSYPGYTGVAPVTYTAPTAYTAGHAVTYPFGYSGVYPVVKDNYEMKTRSRRAAVWPYTAPVAYSATPYVHPVAYTAPAYKTYSPVADVPKGYSYGYGYPGAVVTY